jgi:hypothetical protein
MVSRRAGWIHGWMDGAIFLVWFRFVYMYERSSGQSGHTARYGTARHGAGVLKVAFLKRTCSALLRESYIFTTYLHGRGVDSQFYKFVTLACFILSLYLL